MSRRTRLGHPDGVAGCRILEAVEREPFFLGALLEVPDWNVGRDGLRAARRGLVRRGLDDHSGGDVGPNPATLDASAEFDRVWHEHACDRGHVSLCSFIVGALERSRRAAQLAALDDDVVAG